MEGGWYSRRILSLSSPAMLGVARCGQAGRAGAGQSMPSQHETSMPTAEKEKANCCTASEAPDWYLRWEMEEHCRAHEEHLATKQGWTLEALAQVGLCASRFSCVAPTLYSALLTSGSSFESPATIRPLPPSHTRTSHSFHRRLLMSSRRPTSLPGTLGKVHSLLNNYALGD